MAAWISLELATWERGTVGPKLSFLPMKCCCLMLRALGQALQWTLEAWVLPLGPLATGVLSSPAAVPVFLSKTSDGHAGVCLRRFL